MVKRMLSIAFHKKKAFIFVDDLGGKGICIIVLQTLLKKQNLKNY